MSRKLDSDSICLAFDASPLSGIQAGVYQYVNNVLQNLSKTSERLNIDLFMGNKWVSGQNLTSSPEYTSPGMRIITRISDLFGEGFKLIRKRLNYQNQQRIFNQGLSIYKPDIVHFTQNYFFTGNIPSVYTFYDLSCIRFPETHPKSRVIWYEKQVPLALDNATHIIAISEFSKQELVSFYGVPQEKVSVVPCGVSADFHPLTESEASRTIDKYQLKSKRYLLSIGTLEPRKNLDSIIHAYSALPDNIRKKYKLVIIGAKGWHQDKFTSKHGSLIHSGNLVIPGFVPQADMPALISGAKLSLYPSVYEGFGLPVLESMACGTPVIASNTSAIPEILVNEEVLITPRDIDSWTQCIIRIINDDELESTLSRSGLERSRQFSWSKGAEKMMTLYTALLNGKV